MLKTPKKTPISNVQGKDNKKETDNQNIITTKVPLITPNVASPSALVSYAGVGDNNTLIPPDVAGSPGPNNNVSILNPQFGRFIRDGNNVQLGNRTSLWSQVSATSPFDPRVLYEPYSKRWIFTASNNLGTSSSQLLIGVSTSQEFQSNTQFAITADPSGTSWLDFPQVGFTSTLIVVTGYMFAISDGSYVQTNFYVIDKNSLYSGVLSYQVLTLPPSAGSTFCPTYTYDNTFSNMYIVQRYSSNSGGNGYLRIAVISGSVGSATITLNNNLLSAPAWASQGTFSNGGFAPQSGSTVKIDTGDDRIQNVVYQNGKLWCTHTVFLPATTPTRSSIQWWCITPGTTPTVTQRGLIDDPTGNIFYAYPSIAVNFRDDALIGYCRFSASQFASGNYSYRDHTDAINTFRDDTVLKPGEAVYTKDFGTGQVRWGDYTSTFVDINDEFTFWTYVQYASTSNKWGTWWGRIYPASSTIIGRIVGDFIDQRACQTGVFTPSTSVWTINTPSGQITQSFGISTDIVIPGRMYSAQQNSLAIWRPSNGTYYIMPPIGDTTGSTLVIPWGLSDDIPICGDVNGDGVDEIGVFRSSTGYWYFNNILKNATLFFPYGINGDVPLIGDWYNKGRHQVAVWRPSNNNWYFRDPISGQTSSSAFGASSLGDVPITGDYLNKGYYQIGVWRSSTGVWYIKDILTNQTTSFTLGNLGDVPLEGDFDGDGISDYAVWRPSTQTFIIRLSSTGQTINIVLGTSTSIPTTGTYTYRRMKQLGIQIG